MNIRVFLAAFLIVYRSNHVFEMMGELETTLKNSAMVMLCSFEDIIVKIQKKSRATTMMAASRLPGDDNRQIITKDFVPCFSNT